MKQLLLNRHAEAANPKGINDFDRPLTLYGMSQAKKLAASLKQQELLPELWISSRALRAQTTAAIITKELHIRSILEDRNIYEASEKVLLHIINHLPNECRFAAITGHNPGISYLFYNLCSEIRDVPPCTALLIEFEADDWGELNAGTGTLKWYEAP
jgi:phosphohistidine phosphatase